MKKQLLNFSILILIVLFGFNSCTIKKRSYQPGYYTDWNNVTKKSKTNPENLSKQQQEKFVVENNVDEFEDFNQREIIQEYEPVYASSDENNKIEITNPTNQKNSFSTNTKRSTTETYQPAIIEKPKKSLDLINGDTELHWAAIAGFGSSILAWASMIGWISLQSFLILSLIFFYGSMLFSISAIIISIIAIKRIKANPEKYKGKEIAIAGLVIGTLYALVVILSAAFLLYVLGFYY